MADFDIYHILDHSSSHLLNWLPRKGLKVVTVHDLIPLRYPGHLTAKQVARFEKMVRNLSKADHLICNSEYTKGEVMELLSIPEESVTVVHLGADLSPEGGHLSSQIEKLKERGATHVILSVGSILARKNLAVLAPSLKKLREKHVSIRPALLRVGARLPDELRVELEEVLGAEFLLEAGRLDENDLCGCYAHCDSVVVPSLYEGFGLPVLEAFAFGKPVVASNRASLPEVGGDLAYYFNPDSPDEMSEALWNSFETKDVEEKTRRRLERAREWNWERHYLGCQAVYQKLLDENPTSL